MRGAGAAGMGGLALFAAVLLASCGGGEGPAAEQAAPSAPPAEALSVEERDLPDYKPVSAVLTNRDVGAARARIGGTLTKLLVREGDVVKKGQLVAVVVDERRIIEVNAAAAEAAAAEARAQQAIADFKRVQELFDKGVYAQARLDAARAEAHSAEAQLRAARAQRDALKEITEQGDVLAPADGRVTSAPIPEGAVVMAGEIVAEVATGRRVLRIELPEAEARNIGEGTEIRFASAGRGDKAKIVQVYPAIENGQIVIDIDASGFDDAYVGIRTPVLVPIGVRRAIVIPTAYVSTRYGVDYARLLRPDEEVIDAPIQLGARLPLADGGDGVEVLSGLAPGDVILPSEKAIEPLSVSVLSKDKP